MNPLIARRVSQELKLPVPAVEAVLSLFEEGSTVPFIARYRKEATGSLDEEIILAISDRYGRLEELEGRKKTIRSSLTERGLLTAELEKRIAEASSLTVLEDVYLPFRPKRRTRASMAVQKGLSPLADALFTQGEEDPALLARPFLSAEMEVLTVEEALQGAQDILAERFSEDGEARRLMRRLFGRRGRIRSTLARGKEEEGANFRDYFDREEPAAAAPSHRVLAMFRGEKEKILVLSFLPPEEEALAILRPIFIQGAGPSSLLVRQAVEDGYKRLLAPSMETELRSALKKRADRDAISVFARNIREMMLAPPLGPKNILAVDPGFRTGCKFVCLNRQGDLLHSGVIYPHPPQNDGEGSARAIRKALEDYSIEAVAIGNGTAGRETERFFQKLDLPSSLIVTLVNESGASVYSASEVARKEFPDHDITVRGAVSIGRRLLDPLSELVKIDPKAIGVGQYQHDVDQKDLKKNLSSVVESCVHAVGVNANTASAELLSFVSGIGPSMADQIVRFREEKGPFSDRKSLLSVPRLGAKTFEQAAGFLRIPGGKNPLDGSAVHPERYSLVKKIAADLGCAVEDLMKNRELRQKISPEKYISPDAGMPTLLDILAELEKPGRDPRSSFELFSYAEGVETLEDLHSGMELPGVVTNITSFGAFVDLGVHQDGLVHRNQMSPAERAALKPGLQVKVSVLEVDLPRKRISLSMKTGQKGETVMTPRRVVVIGGGAAGLIAAGRAAEAGASVTLVEKNQTVGSKLILSGKGRCNLTSGEEDLEVFLSKFGPKGKFLYSAFSQFGPRETLEFFNSRGLATKMERGKRIFPARGGSEQVVTCLLNYLKDGGAAVYRNREAINLEIKNGSVVRFLLRGQEIEGDAFILTTGGRSFRKTGSTGDGYRFAQRAGHTVVEPRPALCPVKTKEKWPLIARGLMLKNVSLTLLRNGEVLVQRFGELLLTHFGISGPIAMDMSRDIADAWALGGATLTIDLKPALSLEILSARIGRDFAAFSTLPFREALKDLLPRGIIPVVLSLASIPPDQKAGQITTEEIAKLAALLKAIPLTPDGLLGFDWAIVTAGGVDLKEVDPRTMQSKLVKNLYIAGELLDLDGPTGGFNLQMCWSTGYIAGENAALASENN